MKYFEPSESQNIINSFKALLKEMMDKPNMFIMPYDSTNKKDCTQFANVVSFLKENKENFDVNISELSPIACNLSNYAGFPNNLSFKCIAIDSGKPEKIRDIIKEVLWPTHSDNKNSPTLNKVLSAGEDIIPNPFALSEYGIFVPYKIPKFDTIRTHSFNHKPVFYRYRLATNKTKQLPTKLESYLQLLFTDCPNHLFQKSNFRASARTCDDFKVEVQLTHSQEHELINLARKSTSFIQFKDRHENLQKYFLLNDPRTVACEVPTWLESHELNDYSEIFHTEDILTGHIDVLRYENDGKIGIWDYKPYAAGETDAVIQVFLYALMLSIRTGISIKNFIYGYFDEADVFIVEPLYF
jgi:hypothetical protein